MEENYVTVYRSTNQVEAEIVEDVLRQEGFDPHLIGTRSAALIGVADAILNLRIEVPAACENEARECLEALLNSSEFANAHDDADFEVEDGEVLIAGARADEPHASPPGTRRAAFMFALIFPGGSHFYLHRYVTGFVLLATILCGFGMLVFSVPMAGAVFIVGAICADMLVAQATFPGEGEPPRSGSAQFLTGVAIAAVLLGVAVLHGELAYRRATPDSPACQTGGDTDTDSDTSIPLLPVVPKSQ